MENTFNTTHLKFPIGAFIKQDEYPPDELAAYKALANLANAEDLSKTYRPGSWNVQQLNSSCCRHTVAPIF